MSWPSPQDYNEAVQTPALSFIDAELRSAIAECNKLGLPRCVTGAFASVYHMQDNGKDWAVRCFLHPLIDRTERYERISDFVTHDDLSYTVSFQFLEEGVRIYGNSYPILKMDWVAGETFGAYVLRNLANRDVLLQLAADFKPMVEKLQQAGVAHGDLQHDNIMMSGQELLLVDYDGLFVPSLTGREASELGHRNYQHPFRTKAHFGTYLDNFSAWLIFLSLQCLAIDPHLWHILKGGDDCLLLRQRDFVDPLNSSAFVTLESHNSEEIRRASRFIRSLLYLAVDELPPVNNVTPDSAVPDLPSLEYDRMWWTDYAGTASGAPAAHKKADSTPVESSTEAPGFEEKKAEVRNRVIEYPQIKTSLAFREKWWERSTSEIEIEIRDQLPSDEPIVWTGGLDESYTFWDNTCGHEGAKWLNQMILAIFLVFCTIPLFGFGALVVSFLMLLFLLFRMVLAKPVRHCWYALTDRRLIIAFQDPHLTPRKTMRIISIPLSDITKIDLFGKTSSITVSTRRPISMTEGDLGSSVKLYGFGAEECEQFRDALPKHNFISEGTKIERSDHVFAISQRAAAIRPDGQQPGAP